MKSANPILFSNYIQLMRRSLEGHNGSEKTIETVTTL